MRLEAATRGGAYTRGIILLVLTTLVWGTTFAVVKDATERLSPALIVAARFVVAALAVAPFIGRPSRRLVRDGALLGLVLFASYATQAIGLTATSANRGAFITALNVVLVPIIGRLLGRRVGREAFLAAGLAVGGVGLLSWEGGPLGVGDLWVLGCALAYAVYILLLEPAAGRHPPLQLTAVQLVAVAGLGLAWAAPDLAAAPAALLGPQALGAVLYLGLIATAATTLTQVLAQRVVPAPQTALVYALEPVFAAVFSALLIGEGLGPRGLAGAVVVLGATVWSALTGARNGER